MRNIKSIVTSIGSFITIAGLLSIVLTFIKMNLIILMWIDNWGPTVGWILRIGFVFIGVIIFLIGKFVL